MVILRNEVYYNTSSLLCTRESDNIFFATFRESTMRETCKLQWNAGSCHYLIC